MSLTQNTSSTSDTVEIIDVDAFFEFYKQHFFAEEGSPELPIDVDAGAQDNPISVEQWIALSNSDVDAALFKCAICFGIFVKPVMPLCMHAFCYNCIRANLRYRKTCPICRAVIKEQPIRDKLLEQALAKHLKRSGLRTEASPGGYDWEGVVFG
ncbi:hypothetical protein C8J57DRAFT_1539975 [Mycena rebaudengoi]|nr:hypothetical protein C8J57DRAFT_1539975 [Mycena rebaudengoi]